MCVFREHRHAFQAHVPEFRLPFKRSLCFQRRLIGSSKWLMPQLNRFGQKEILQICFMSSNALSVTFLRGLGGSSINRDDVAQNGGREEQINWK